MNLHFRSKASTSSHNQDQATSTEQRNEIPTATRGPASASEAGDSITSVSSNSQGAKEGEAKIRVNLEDEFGKVHAMEEIEKQKQLAEEERRRRRSDKKVEEFQTSWLSNPMVLISASILLAGVSLGVAYFHRRRTP